jgi:YHS domain-containing protein
MIDKCRRLRLSTRTIWLRGPQEQENTMKCCRFGFCPLVLAIAFVAAASLLAAAGKPAAREWKGDVYTLDTCPVTGKKLGSMGDPVVKKIDEREVRFCCEPCIEKFESDKDKYWKQIDEKLTEQQIKHYPLKHCVVMGEDSLEKPEGGGEGEDGPVNLVYRNRLVRFCCSGCPKDFKEDPAAYIAKLDKAVIEQQKDKYPLETCPVSGEKLGGAGMGEPVNYVVGTTLIRFCNESCIKEFEKNPQPVLAKVHEGWKAKHAAEGGH